MPRPPDPAGAVAEALAGLAQGKQSACIPICDITRPVPNGLFLRPRVDRLVAAGVPLGRIAILVATGLHRPDPGDEPAELVGDPWVLAHVRVGNHDARNGADHVDLGVTGAHAVPIQIDRRFVDAGLRIATGLVEPHFMAGEAQLEIAARIGEIEGLDTVPDGERLVHVNFGEIASHLAAVDLVRDRTAMAVGRRFRTVVTSSAGYPLDRTRYQTVKGMLTPLEIPEPGGTLIVASEGGEATGSPEFRRSQERLVSEGPERFLDGLRAKSLAAVDEWRTEMQLKPMRAAGRVQLSSTGPAAADRRATGVETIEELGAARREAIERADDPEIAIIAEGPFVVPLHVRPGEKRRPAP